MNPKPAPGDDAWAGVARGARTALHNLGHPVDPDCLPGEPEPCGGSFAEHCVAYFAAIAAVTDHQMEHLGIGPRDPHASDIYNRTLETIRRDCQLDEGRSTGAARER